MRDFIDDLEQRLAAMAEEHPDLAPAATHAPATRERRRRWRRPFALGGATAAIAAIAATVTMTGTSLADLPILTTPTQDASQLEEQADEAAEAGVDFTKAHVFGTPGGPGYALLNRATQTICLVIPDPEAPGEFGGACGTPLEKVEREGLAAELVGDLGQDPAATSLVAFILPEGASDVQLSPRPRGATLDVESGVAVVQSSGPAQLTWTVDGQQGRRQIEGPFQATTSFVLTCSDGRTVSVPAPEAQRSDSADDSRAQMRELRRQACD